MNMRALILAAAVSVAVTGPAAAHMTTQEALECLTAQLRAVEDRDAANAERMAAWPRILSSSEAAVAELDSATRVELYEVIVDLLKSYLMLRKDYVALVEATDHVVAVCSRDLLYREQAPGIMIEEEASPE